ncbi:tyrosine-type recombinase/integrase [bacterium]|nr:tyrosine-type recombinase/integrase [bacterium]
MPTQDSVDPIMKKRVMNGAEYAYVRIEGEFHSLGRWGTRDSIARFEKVLAEWRATIIGREQPTDRILTVGELAENYLQHETDRRDAGEVTRSTWYAARAAMLVLVKSHAGTPAVRFGPKALKSIQTRLAVEPCMSHAGRFRDDTKPPPLSRAEVNRRINLIRSAFKWAVSEELVPASTLEALKAVQGLRRGAGRELPERTAVDPEIVEETAVRLEEAGHRGMADMLRFLRWTGCRPAEACGATFGDIETGTDGFLWIRLSDHKTAKATGRDRRIPLNHSAAKIVTASMAAASSIDPTRHLFQRRGGQPITTNGLGQAVRRTVHKYQITSWMPYQMRHLAATEAVAATGSETAAAALLGHSPSSTVVRRYSTQRDASARLAADAIDQRIQA